MYFGSPEYTDAGYGPQQPVPYSHKVHAGDLGMDCRYCHSHVEISRHAQVPPTKTCMNCHVMIKANSEALKPIRESWDNGDPIRWIRVHNLPDYAYFDHSAHLNAGVGCISCHGRVDTMTVVMQQEPLSMGWCLQCHRNPSPHLRPVSEVANFEWKIGNKEEHKQWAENFMRDRQISPPEMCSGCHR